MSNPIDDCSNAERLARACPFCGERCAVVTDDLNGKHYFAVGCRTPGCFAYVHANPVALPMDQAALRLKAWNRRAGDSEDDGELVDTAWLESVGFTWDGSLLTSPGNVVLCETWGMYYIVCNGRPTNITTRGDLRNLCASLGVTLEKERP